MFWNAFNWFISNLQTGCIEIWNNATSVSSMVIALLALYVAIRDLRANHSVELKILEFEFGHVQHAGENGDRVFSQLSCKVLNLGLTLHKPDVCLSLKYGISTFEFPFNRGVLPCDREEFSKGMYAVYSLKSYGLSSYYLKELEREDWTEKKIVVKSQGFVVKEFHFNGLYFKLQGLRNWIFLRALNYLAKARVSYKNSKMGHAKSPIGGLLLKVIATSELFIYKRLVHLPVQEIDKWLLSLRTEMPKLD